MVQFNLWVARLVGRVQELREREDGQAMVEYALILGLVSVVAIAALEAIGTGVLAKLTDIATALGQTVG